MISETLSFGILLLIFPLCVGISLIIATYFYNKNYYLETKIKYEKIKNEIYKKNN